MGGAVLHRLVLGMLLVAATPAGARDLAEIRSSGTLRICVAGSSVAFYQRNGQAFARFLGVQPEITTLRSFDEQFHNGQGITVQGESYVPQLLADGSCDVYPNDLHIVGWRESKIRMVPYYGVRNVALVRRDLLPALRGIPDLAGLTAAVQQGTAYDDWIKRANSEELAERPATVIYAPTSQSVTLVAEGKADFTIVGTEGALKWVREDVKRLAIAFPVSEPVQVGWGMHPSAKALAAEARRFFDESSRRGSDLDLSWRHHYQVSLREYQLLEASFAAGRVDLKSVLSWVLPAGVSALLLLASMVFWNRRLKRTQDALRAANAEQDAIFESASAGIALVRNTRIHRGNNRLEEMFGRAKGEAAGMALTAFLGLPHEEREETTVRARAALSRGETHRQERLLARKDGSSFWCRYSGHAIDPRDLGKGSVWILEDVSEERAAAEALRAAKRTAEEATRAKSMFLATMSHEIRTPMNGVLGMLQLLDFTRLDAEQKATLDGARDSARSLLGIIDDLLDFSKIEAGRLEIRPEPTSVAAVIEGVRLVYAGLASAKDLTLGTSVDTGVSAAVMVDTLRLRQILNNFVSNAIKFTREGRIDIAVTVTARGEGRETLRFSVTDTGIGVSNEAQARLFQPYVQATGDTARQYGGTGLGLTICRRLADMMHAVIEMSSEPGKGTTMSLTLPVAIADARDLPRRDTSAAAVLVATRRAAPTVAQAEAEGTLVLVAEDHPTNRRLLTRLLGLLGYAAETADDGKAALEKWRSGRFAVLLTDCNMPEMDGYELAQAIRAAEGNGTRRTPIIACTANALAGEVDKCLAAGMDDFIAKPVEVEALAAVMGRWLALSEGASATAAVRPAKVLAASPDVPLDRGSLAQVTGGDAQMEREILADLRSASDADMAALRAALDGTDLAAVVRVAHRMKGACRTVGAAALAEVCARVEGAGRRGDAAAVASERAALEREFGRLADWLSLQTAA